jgi:hypothetical protein
MIALAAVSVMPLFHAAQQSAFYGALMTIEYALLGGALVLGLSPWLWPRAWADAEHALPIEKSERRRSDLTVVIFGLSPIFAIYALGTVNCLVHLPTWMQAIWGQAIFMLLASMGLSVALGFAILQWRRGLSPNLMPVRYSRSAARRAVCRAGHPQRLSCEKALVVLPLLRGPAQRSFRFFTLTVLTVLALLTCAVAPIRFPNLASCWLAAFAAFAQAMVTRLNVLVAADLEPMHAACATLPIHPTRLKWARRAVVMLPLSVGQLFLIAAISFGPVPIRPLVFTMYLLAMQLGNGALVVAASAPPVPGMRDDSAARVSGWLLVLALPIAITSEVVL